MATRMASELLAFGAVGVALYLGYQAILPKPIADIPYNRDAAEKLFGDIPEMMRYVMRTGRIFVSLYTHHISPPFSCLYAFGAKVFM